MKQEQQLSSHRLKVILILAVTLGVIAIFSGNFQPTQVSTSNAHQISGMTMGTSYSVKVIDLPDQLSLAELQKGIFQAVDRIDQLMSTYKASSELSRFNQLGVDQWFQVSPETLAVFELAMQISQSTAGAFEPTIGPIVNLWGFGPDKSKLGQPPSQEALTAALAQVNYAGIQVDPEQGRIKKDQPMYVDFSAIAKGYGVDEVARYLDQQGVSNYLVEVGGELRLKGEKAPGQPWKIAVETPVADSRVPLKALALTDVAIATSGDYRNYYEKDGQRYSHTIDARTGYPITHKLASVTVITADCATADALATAFSVMGTEQTLNYAKEKQIAVFLIEKSEAGFQEFHSEAFETYLKAS